MIRNAAVWGVLFVMLSLPWVANAAEPPPAQVVDQFHADMAAGKTKQALSLLSDDVLIFEQGFADAGREAYGATDFKSDEAFAEATKRRIVNRHIYWFNNAACVVTQSRIVGKFKGHDINLVSTETALVRKFGGNWQIVHIHWSAHPASNGAMKR